MPPWLGEGVAGPGAAPAQIHPLYLQCCSQRLFCATERKGEGRERGAQTAGPNAEQNVLGQDGIDGREEPEVVGGCWVGVYVFGI